MGLFSMLFSNTDNNLLATALKNGALIIDVRTVSEFASGSVRGAINIPVSDLPFKIAALKDAKNIVVFCRSGNRSSIAKQLLENNGWQDVVNGGSIQNVQKNLNQK